VPDPTSPLAGISTADGFLDPSGSVYHPCQHWICHQPMCYCVCHLCVKRDGCAAGKHSECQGTSETHWNPVSMHFPGEIEIRHCGCSCHVFYKGFDCRLGQHSACPGTWVNDPGRLSGYHYTTFYTKHCACACHLRSA